MAEALCDWGLKGILIVECVESDGLEDIFYANILHCTSFNVCLCLFSVNPLLHDLLFMNGIHCINLVSNKNYWNLSCIVSSCLHEDLSPLLKILVRLSWRDVKHQDASVTSSVKWCAQALETLLPRCVPKLQIDLNATFVEAKFLFGKFSSNCRFCRLWNLLIIEGLNKRTLSNSRIADDYDLEETFLWVPLSELRHY